MIFDFLFDEEHTKKKKRKRKRKNTSKKKKIKKKKKFEEKPIYGSTYLALMLHKNTQPAMSLSFKDTSKFNYC